MKTEEVLYVHFMTSEKADGPVANPIELCRRPEGRHVWGRAGRVVSCPDCKQIMKERKMLAMVLPEEYA